MTDLCDGAGPGDHLTLTVEEVARSLGISRTSAYNAINRNEIPHLRVGGRIVIPRDRFKTWLANSTRA